MATLGSPGVQVTVIDESFYTPAAPGTTPLIFVATAQDKSNASGTGTAQGTTAANAGTVYVITSQRDLSDTFGTPLFYTDSSSNPVHGGELNEYGLQAAYSALGVSSRAYIVRADVDLAELTPNSSAPTGTPVSGTYWIDTDASLYGVKEFTVSGSVIGFTTKTPLIIDNSNIADDTVWSGVAPTIAFGNLGDYAMVVTSDNTNQLFYKRSNNGWSAVQGGFDGGKSVQIGPHTDYPTWTSSTTAGSVWVQTTTPGLGANWAVKYYNGSTESWTTVSAPIYNSASQAIEKLDPAGGGKNIPVGSLFVESDYQHNGLTTSTTAIANFKVWRRAVTTPTTIVSAASTGTTAATSTFTIRETKADGTWDVPHTCSIAGSVTIPVASRLPAAVSQTGLTNVSATYDAITKKVTITHALGGNFELRDGTNTPLSIVGFTAYNMTKKQIKFTTTNMKLDKPSTTKQIPSGSFHAPTE